MDRVFLAGETEEGGFLTTSYATHHRHSCIGARAGFGDLLIGAGALMVEANGLDTERHGPTSARRWSNSSPLRRAFCLRGCGVGLWDEGSGGIDHARCGVFEYRGNLLLATKIYDMHRLAHYVSGRPRRRVARAGRGSQSGNPGVVVGCAGWQAHIPASQRLEVARFIEDLTASHQAGWYSVISLHGGGSPEAMKREIWRNYPVMEKRDLVERLLDRGVLDEGQRVSKQPGRCCATGCAVPAVPTAAE